MKGFVQTHQVKTRTLTISEEDLLAFKGILQNTTIPSRCIISKAEIDLAQGIAVVLEITNCQQTDQDISYQEKYHGNVFRRDL